MTAPPPSGEQFEISHGDQRVTVVEVGGGIRTFDHGNRPVLEPYDLDVRCDGAHGNVLVPWPNRVRDGRYSWDGVEQQLDLTEPKRSNASHGLARWRNWVPMEHEADRVMLAIALFPQTGWPWPLSIEVLYELGDRGLTVTTTAVNLGDEPCPYAVGHHPYLAPGPIGATVDDAVLQVSAEGVIVADERLIPVGHEDVADSEVDFRTPARIGDRVIDRAYDQLVFEADGRVRCRLTGTDDRTVELWADDRHPILQVFTGDTLAPERRRTGLAVEPMTAPANALATGDHLVTLSPDTPYTTTWGVALVD